MNSLLNLIKIVLPSTPYDAKGLLKSAIRDDNPVVSFECSRLDAFEGEVPDGDYTVPIGVGEVKRPGTDVTIVALGYMVHLALAAADGLAREGISVDDEARVVAAVRASLDQRL